MLRLKTSIVAWSGSVWATGFEEFTMTEFLDAHMNNNSEHYGELCLHSSTLESNCQQYVLCQAFVRVRSYRELSEIKAINVYSTIQPTIITNHGLNISQYCWPHGRYNSLIVNYSAEVGYFMDKYALKMHADEIAKSALVFDDNNIELFQRTMSWL
ncbi:MAG: hypothetical protein J3R72DRAFT_487444 [Linnemannia gamsii]|nr:MAG: hypothetical protein J3R72DRAFT_487444 [Linnemannia gamsii]